MAQHAGQVRLLTTHDISAIERLIRTSEYMYQRFTLDELPLMLEHYPAVGILHSSSLYGFLLSHSVNASCAWIGGFGVSWTESHGYLGILSTLLDRLSAELIRHGIRYLHYSGNDVEGDWLRSALLTRHFAPYRMLYAYDKFDYIIPTLGNQQVHIRPVRLAPHYPNEQSDLPALLSIEEACFENIWRYSALGFSDIAATHPYFVVAERDGNVLGYQFNALDGDSGYLVRIAVHPSAEHQGIGARLLAEAIRFFQQAHVSRILLNTQEENVHAHRLYEWFGFERIQQRGFVLRKNL
jgi:ribosomal-protein-alanine N-acetyltransferase